MASQARHRLGTLLTAAIICLTACLGCNPRHAATATFHAINVDSGWNRQMPLVFTPQYPDSDARYDISLAIRHTNQYAYANLSLTADLLADSGHAPRRSHIVFTLADEAGNWQGAGFGTLYQAKQTIARRVSPHEVRRVAVWQTMTDVPTVRQIAEVGIIVTPSN